MCTVATGVLCRCGEQREIGAVLINSCREVPFLTHQHDYLQRILEVVYYTAKETQRWSAVIPDKTSKGKKQPYKASVDLCLVVLRGPMQSIIDLGAIIQRPA